MAKTPRKSGSRAPNRKSSSGRTAIKPEVIESEVIEPEIIDPEIVEPEFVEPGLPGLMSSSTTGTDLFDDAEVIEPEIIDSESSEAQVIQPEVIPGITGPNNAKAASSKALAPTDPVAMYLAEIRRYPLLTREQEQELAIRYRETGDAQAAERLVTSNLRFVVKVAAEYSRFGAKLIDLIQEGNVGLMHAVKEFNPYKGVRLITYAVWWIRGYIQEYLMRQYSMVRIGTTQNQRKLFYRLQKERELLDSMGREPNIALLSSRLGVSEEEVETMTKRLAGRDISLNQPLDSTSNASASLLDFEASDDPGVDDQLGHLEEMEVLKRDLERIRPKLNEKETYVLEKRLLADEPQTLQEIGEHFGVTREAVRQIEARLIGKIRSAVTESLGDHLTTLPSPAPRKLE